MKTAQTLYSEIVAYVTGDIVQISWCKENLDVIERCVQDFKDTLLEMFDKQYAGGLYTLSFYLQDHMVEYVWGFELLPVLNSILHKHGNIHIEHVYRRTLQRGRTQMMEMVSVMERTYKRTLSSEK